MRDSQPSPIDAAIADTGQAVAEFDDATRWIATAELRDPLAVEVWVFDEALLNVVLVKHRWRGWVPPGGKVEPGETPRQAARRELFEETGLRLELLPAPAAVAVRSYRPGWAATLGLSYVAITERAAPLVSEDGQEASWTALDDEWATFFPDDPARIRAHAGWLARPAAHGRAR